MAAGRHWATGGAPADVHDGAAADAAMFGIDLDDVELPATSDADLWPQNLPAVSAFVAVSNQWRCAAGLGGLIYTSLDYAAAESGLRLAGITTTPELWADVRTIERGAIAAMREARS